MEISVTGLPVDAYIKGPEAVKNVFSDGAGLRKII